MDRPVFLCRPASVLKLRSRLGAVRPCSVRLIQQLYIHTNLSAFSTVGSTSVCLQ